MGERQTANGVGARLRTLRLILGALLAGVVLYAALALVLLPLFEPKDIEGTEINVCLGPLLVLSLILVYVSYSAKFRMLAEASAERRPDKARRAIFTGLAWSEAAALVGLAGVITGNPLALGIIAVGACGLVLHYPRRDQLSAAGQTAGEV